VIERILIISKGLHRSKQKFYYGFFFTKTAKKDENQKPSALKQKVFLLLLGPEKMYSFRDSIIFSLFWIRQERLA
jgi:hypothetical protein